MKFLVLLGVPMGTVASLSMQALHNASAATVLPTSRPATTQATPAVAFAAMDYYQQNCAHCHGPQGSFYGPTLGQKLTDAQLVKVIDDMASGPGNAPLKSTPLAAEVAFHRALIMRVPFVSVTQIEGDGKWAGEATPDATVTIVVGQQRVNATHDDTTWTATIPPNTDPAKINITAELNGIATTLKPAEASYSSGESLPDAARRPK